MAEVVADVGPVVIGRTLLGDVCVVVHVVGRLGPLQYRCGHVGSADEGRRPWEALCVGWQWTMDEGVRDCPS
jgi:hypothetical protein